MATVAHDIIERRRQEEQARLDGQKTAVERNKWGQFATPPGLARSLAHYFLFFASTRLETSEIKICAKAEQMPSALAKHKKYPHAEKGPLSRKSSSVLLYVS